MNKYLMIAATLFLLQACNSSNAKKEDATAQPQSFETAKPSIDSFFPLTSYMKGQLVVLDSMPVTPMLLTTINGKTDSCWSTIQKMKPYIQPFLSPEITETNMIDLFTQSKFQDQTINAITFTYDPKKVLPDSIAIRHWDVYVDPERGTVKKIYIVKQVKENNQPVTLQFTWEPEKMIKINTIANTGDGKSQLLKEQTFTWDF